MIKRAVHMAGHICGKNHNLATTLYMNLVALSSTTLKIHWSWPVAIGQSRASFAEPERGLVKCLYASCANGMLAYVMLRLNAAHAPERFELCQRTLAKLC